jgi:Xaa-Pro dipeptidase
MRVKEHSLLTTFAPQATIAPADPLITALRLVKDSPELKWMKAAVVLAETVLQETLPKIEIGMTEREVAAELTVGLFRAGSETLPFEPLVQTGITGANPHALGGDRKLAAGDLLIIDFGARVQGYVSDITRTFAVGDLNDKARQIYEIVKQANQAGREAAKPGVACQTVDRATREVIKRANFGKYFTHRTGHGLGLEPHEPPFIVAGNATPLQPGMTFTVEPGIYLPGFGGVRIEDDVVITKDGVESLTTFSRNLMKVGC